MAWATTTTLAVLAIAATVASTTASMVAASQQADAAQAHQRNQQTINNAQIEENYRLAVASAQNQYTQLQNRASQEGERASAEEAAAAKEGLQARATARTAAGEAGVAGLSVNALLNDFMRQETNYRSMTRTNLGNVIDQLEAEGEGVKAGASGQANAIPRFVPEPINRPSYLGAALRIGGSALDTYTRFKGPNTANTPREPDAYYKAGGGYYM